MTIAQDRDPRRNCRSRSIARKLAFPGAVAAACTATLIAAVSLLSSSTNRALAADPTTDETFRFFDKPATQPPQHHDLARVNLESLEMKSAQTTSEAGVVYPLPELPQVDITSTKNSGLEISHAPHFHGRLGYKYAAITDKKNIVFYTLDPELQQLAQNLVRSAQANHVAIAVMNPRTGAVLALAGKSFSVNNVEYHAGFPAASLFKVVTAAAAVENAGLSTDSLIPFRGGNYTLNHFNYLPDARRDRRLMSIGEAMGKSCNPVFGHIGLKYLNAPILASFASRFGFNQSLGFEAPLEKSAAFVPDHDAFALSRTAAGFGQVTISPIHAAAMVSSVGNGGLLPRPFIVEKITTTDGSILLKTEPQVLHRVIDESTSRTLLDMMQYTTTSGTSRREFMRGQRPVLGNIDVAAKTGTLNGTNPKGLNNWFIATAPVSNPQIAVAVITVDARRASKASALGRRVFERFFNVAPSEQPSLRTAKSSKKFIHAKRYQKSKKASPNSRSSKSKKKNIR
jgi:peptidoglycan glycosyltransferase